MKQYAYITLLSTDNYLYGCIGLMYSWKNTNSHYPFYCIVTSNITEQTKEVLRKIGYILIEEPIYIPQSYYTTLQKIENGELQLPLGYSTSDLMRNGWQYGWSKFHIFKYDQFDKLLYIDADSFVLQNMDFLFEKPEWSGVYEWGSYERNYYRFLSAFLLIKPSKELYNSLIQFAEDNPIIIHPGSQQPQLSNDYDLLNLYYSDWTNHSELHLPPYVYVDSYFLSRSQFKYWFNNANKITAIHLSDKKPWLEGRGFQPRSDEFGLWKELYLFYIDFLNDCLLDLHNKGIDLPMVN